jgi:hypothetical protein
MAAGIGAWATVDKAAKTMDPNNKDSGGEFKLPEQKEGRKASAPKNTMRKRFKKLKKQDRNALKY